MVNQIRSITIRLFSLLIAISLTFLPESNLFASLSSQNENETTNETGIVTVSSANFAPGALFQNKASNQNLNIPPIIPPVPKDQANGSSQKNLVNAAPDEILVKINPTNTLNKIAGMSFASQISQTQNSLQNIIGNDPELKTSVMKSEPVFKNISRSSVVNSPSKFSIQTQQQTQPSNIKNELA
jgi:hypothetical protein